MNKYLGHPSQMSGIDEVILAKGKGKGLTLLEIRNGLGLHLTLSVDRCMDISRLSFKGDNMGYFAPSGYVSPSFYDNRGDAFLKSFTAGFLTTCGLEGAGKPCIDSGMEIPMHGSISNSPCEHYYYTEDDDCIKVYAEIRDAALFSVKLYMHRTYIISKRCNKITIKDCIENVGVVDAPCMLLYHFNMGYPLLSENAKVFIPHKSAVARDAHAQTGFDKKLEMEKPQNNYVEMCYYYDMEEHEGMAKAGIFNPDIKKGLCIKYNKDTLDNFIQWKMMGETEYVLGLEPANCTPDGRDVMREKGMLKIINPGDKYETFIEIDFTESEDSNSFYF